MSLATHAQIELENAREFFDRSTRNLAEAHSTFAPAPEMMTTAVATSTTSPPWPPSPPSGPPFGAYFSRRNEISPSPPLPASARSSHSSRNTGPASGRAQPAGST